MMERAESHADVNSCESYTWAIDAGAVAGVKSGQAVRPTLVPDFYPRVRFCGSIDQPLQIRAAECAPNCARISAAADIADRDGCVGWREFLAADSPGLSHRRPVGARDGR